MPLEILRLVHHFRKVLFSCVVCLSSAVCFAAKDKVYFRIESDYFSGWEVKKYKQRMHYFSCLYPESAALKVLERYYNHKHNKKKALKELVALKIDDSLKFNARTHFYLTYFKLTRFLKGHSLALSPQLLKNIKDQIHLSDCRFDKKYEKDIFLAIKPFYQLEVFLKSRFNLNLSKKKLNYRSAFNFLDSIDGQYRHEFFN